MAKKQNTKAFSLFFSLYEQIKNTHVLLELLRHKITQTTSRYYFGNQRNWQQEEKGKHTSAMEWRPTSLEY